MLLLGEDEMGPTHHNKKRPLPTSLNLKSRDVDMDLLIAPNSHVCMHVYVFVNIIVMDPFVANLLSYKISRQLKSLKATNKNFKKKKHRSPRYILA